MRSLILLVCFSALCACATPLRQPDASGHWVYVGDDPAGTQNIFMKVQESDKKQKSVTAWFRFQFTTTREIVTAPALKQVPYAERHDLVKVDCDNQTLTLLDETFHDVDGKQVYKVVPAADGSTAKTAFAEGVSDVLYTGACGNALPWHALGEDTQKTQEIYALVENPGAHDVIVKARFRFVYHQPHGMVAAPSLNTVQYLSRQSSVLMDCANRRFSDVHDSYYDEDGVAVFGVSPPKDAPPTPVVADGVSGMMYNAACGVPQGWVFLGDDPRKTQKLYLQGTPASKAKDTMEARFRFDYLAPGKLATDGGTKQVEYTSRSDDVLVDCGAKTITLLHSSYLNPAGTDVFDVSPAPAGQQPAPIVADGLSGMQYRAVCHP
jgi:hypothetical protein